MTLDREVVQVIALGLLAVVIVLAVAFGVSRSRTGGDRGDERSHEPGNVGAVPVDHWVAAGLISAEQARAISDFEAARVHARIRPRISPGIEALAYVGGVLLAVGAAMLVAQFWSELGTGGQIAVLAVTSAVVGVVGIVVGESDGVAWRLRGFLWALATIGAAAVAGLFTAEVLGGSPISVAVAAAGCGAVVSAGYWQLRDRPLQHLLTFVGLSVAAATALVWVVGAGDAGLGVGILLWGLGGLWAGLGWWGRIPPSRLGFVLGIAVTLIGAGWVGAGIEWLAPLLGLATAAVWIAVGVVRSDRLALVPGIIGVFVFLPWTLGYFFGGTLGAPVVAMVSGAALLVVVLVLLRHGGDGRRGRRPARGQMGAYGSPP